MKDSIQTNYHNALNSFCTELDPVIQLFQKQKAEGKLNQNYLPVLIAAPVREVLTYNGIQRIRLVLLILGLLIVPPFTIGYILNIFYDYPFLFIFAGIIMFVLSYMLILKKRYLPKMLDLNSNEFHLGAYRKKRPREFKLFNRSILFNDFSFTGLKDYVNSVLTQQEKELETVRIVTETFKKESSLLREQIQEVKNKHEDAMLVLKQGLNDYEEEIRGLETINSSLLYLIENINILLFRLNNGKLSISDLAFLSGFTIYERKEDRLSKISDHGTTGASPKVILFNDKKYKDYSSILVAKSKQKLQYEIVRENYYIVSYRMKMGIGNNKYWIFNFHLNIHSNKRGWHLLLNNDIINTEETYRLFHAFCLILINDDISRKEDNYNATS